MVATQLYPITGIPVGRGPNGEVPVRMEVDEWFKSRKYIHQNQQSLVFSSLAKMYDTSPHDKLSYYQIAGIHNQPIVPWDNAPFENKNYCMHSQANFPTWHRPYVVLLEQRMWEVMTRDIIPQFPKEEQDELRHAASLWRFPYWDWAMKKQHNPDEAPNYDVPLIIREEKVEVRAPQGGTTMIRNPFYQFWMFNDVAMGDPKLGQDIVTREPYNRSSGTSRHAFLDGSTADSAYDEDHEKRGIQNNNGVRDQLQQWKCDSGGSITLSLRDWWYRILLITPYPQFATKKADLGLMSGQYSSCEDIHDTIHDWGGGNFGHMGAPAVGAMDPLFWLHHCNIDRMLELWAGLHPKESKDWLEKDPEATLPLIPFRTNEYGDYHTARTTWKPESFNYTYPDTQRHEEKYQTDGVFDEDKLASELTIMMNLKYNSAAQAQKKAELTNKREAPLAKSITDPDVAKVAAEVTDVQAQIEGAEVAGAKITAVPEGVKHEDLIPEVLSHKDYVANVIYEKYALDGHPFTIRFFIGPVPEGSGAAITQALTQVGEIYAFVDPVEFGQGGCENCAKQKRERLKTTGQVPLTNALLTRFKQQIPHETAGAADDSVLASMEPEHIIPFLKEHFHWRVTDREGKLIDKTLIASMKVSVAMGTGEHFQDLTKLSKFTDYKILYDITADAESGTGAKPEDNLFRHNAAQDMSGMVIAAVA